MRQSFNTEIKFMTMLLLDSWNAVKQLSGEDYETAYVPPKALEVLSRLNARSKCYEILAQLDFMQKQYVEFKDFIQDYLPQNPQGETWLEPKNQLNLPYKLTCPTRAKKLEEEIGLTRGKSNGRALVRKTT